VNFCCLATPPDASIAARWQSGVTHVRRILVSLKMTERLGQPYCIKFCQKLGDILAEKIRKIHQAFVQHLEQWIVCTPLSVNFSLTLATQQHFQ
jgi:hypothetical protein